MNDSNARDAQDNVSPAMREKIAGILANIEARHDVRILYACESGSRGWGFPSPDSDYDVRFIYAHPLSWYLQVSAQRDVIEMPISDELDVNGWELRKALGLLKKGNATLVEWLSSPIQYRADAAFMQAMHAAIQITYQPERAFQHYLHMARGNYREYLHGGSVRLKKYLYVLRPILAAMWIEQEKGAVPMRFQDLVDRIVTDPDLLADIDRLLILKRAAKESEHGEPIASISAFIATQIERLSRVTPPDVSKLDFSVLDVLLKDTVLGARSNKTLQLHGSIV